jgi:hypothetical protein
MVSKMNCGRHVSPVLIEVHDITGLPTACAAHFYFALPLFMRTAHATQE